MSDPSTDHADHFTDHTGRFLGPAYSAQVSTGLTYNVRELRAQRRHVLGDGGRGSILTASPFWTAAVSYTHLTLPTTPYV